VQADITNLEVLRTELGSARVERDLLQAALLLDTAQVERFRTSAIALAESVPSTIRSHTREAEAFRAKLERLGSTLGELSKLLRELPGTVHIGPLDNALSRLSLLQTLPHATGDELLPIIPLIDTALSSLRRVCNALPGGAAVSGSAAAAKTATASTASLGGTSHLPTAIRLERALQQLTARLAREHGKELQLDTLGLELVPDDWYTPIHEACAELLANAAEHGIETPAGRIAAGKARIGKLQLHFTARHGVLELTMRDDGRGLDVRGIFRSAITAGAWPVDDARRDPRDAARLIFKLGVTTASGGEGRGGGLRRVLTHLKGLGARIRVSSEHNHHLQLRAELPVVEIEQPLRRQALA